MRVTFSARIDQGRIVPLADIGPLAVKLSRLKAGVVRVVVDDEKPRSLAQNARYWKLIVPAFSEYTGYEAFPESAERMGLAPKDSAHEVLKAMFLPEVAARTATGKAILRPDGSPVMVRPSTASLTVAQFAELQEKAERFLNAEGIYLPAHEEAA